MHRIKAVHGRADATARPSTRMRGPAIRLVGLLIVITACSGDSPVPVLPTTSRLQASAIGAAAAAIGPDGRIQLAAPVGEGERELTGAEATSYAEAWARDYGLMSRSWLEQTRGAAIDPRTLKSCTRALYARSTLNAPAANIPAPYRRVHGPWWLVTLCDQAGTPTVSVAVSAWATDLTMEKGRLRFPRIGGAELVAIGIPVGHIGEYPSAPELAIEIAARQTGRRVSQLPELVTPPQIDGPPQLARWRLKLDGPSALRTKTGVRTVNEVFVSPASVGKVGLVTSIAASGQPATIDLDWAPLPVIGQRGTETAGHARASRVITKLTPRTDAVLHIEPISAPENR
jgi:hypothetical protein